MRASILLLGSIGCSEFGLKRTDLDPQELKADLSVDPEFLDFGVVPSGSAADGVVTLTSVGTLPVTISALDLEDSDAFTLTDTFEETVLDPGESTDVIIGYVPATHLDQGNLVVHSDAVEPTTAVPLTGEGEYPWYEVDPSPVYLVSQLGEEVTEDVVVTSTGTTDLELYGMVLQADQFTVDGHLPVTLSPGQSTVLTVTYYPEEAGETVTGKLWLDTNTSAGSVMVPLQGHMLPVCMGLGEAWDKGELEASMGHFNSLKVSNLSGENDICIDSWYVWLSNNSQDLGAGDMNGDAGDDYPLGSLGIGLGRSLTFKAEGYSGPAWYCMEETQYTSGAQTYTFTGARVPEPMLTYMLNGDQEGSWAWQLDNPVMIAGRGTNLVDVSPSGGSATVTLRILNMGGAAGTAEVREPIPPGYSASGFSKAPIATETNDDGDTVYVFSVSLAARTETDLYSPTLYDEADISYTLTVPSCDGRTYFTPMETRWTDSDGVERTDTANPLAIVCE